MQILAWNDYLKTGIAIVDQQHRGLVDLANETASKLSSGDDFSAEEMRTLLGYLTDYAEIHFGTEEALMALAGVDERHAEHHHQSHTVFLQQVKAMLAELGEGALTGHQMMDFLGNWLIYHMLGEDQNMGRQLRALTNGASAKKAFEEVSGKHLDPAQEVASQSLSRLYTFMANQAHQLLANEREQRRRGEALKALVASLTADLNASEERFRALFHNGVLPILIPPPDQVLMPGLAVDAGQASAFLGGLPLFRNVAPEDLVRLAAACRERRLSRGEILFHKGDKARSLFLVIGGQMKLAISSAQGNEKVLGIFGARQTFGEAEVVMDCPYPFFAQALEDSTLLVLPQSELLEVLDRDKSLARGLLGCLGLRLHGLVQDVESFTLRTGTERVIGYLLQHAYLQAQGRMEVALPARKQVIASLLHLTPETLSRIFHDLSDAGLIRVKGRHVHIPDADRLTAWQVSDSGCQAGNGRARRSGSA
jgi:hemerythrin-like metal-binding protein